MEIDWLEQNNHNFLQNIIFFLRQAIHFLIFPTLNDYIRFITLFFYRQLHFSSQPGVANRFWKNEAESCLVVA